MSLDFTVECPYCGFKSCMDVDDEGDFDVTCGKCGNKFNVDVQIYVRVEKLMGLHGVPLPDMRKDVAGDVVCCQHCGHMELFGKPVTVGELLEQGWAETGNDELKHYFFCPACVRLGWSKAA